jgi:MFS transporter, ACS family, D-galactonate transporter
VAWLIATLGWRGSFIVTGLIGVIWAVAWWFISRDPEHYRPIAPEAVDALLPERRSLLSTNPEARVSSLDLFRCRTVRGMMIGLFCLNFTIYFVLRDFAVTCSRHADVLFRRS